MDVRSTPAVYAVGVFNTLAYGGYMHPSSHVHCLPAVLVMPLAWILRVGSWPPACHAAAARAQLAARITAMPWLGASCVL